MNLESDSRVICVGLTTVDVIQYCSGWPAWGTKGQSEHTYVDVGGPAANAAVTAALLGARVRLVTLIGQGPLCSFASARLAEYGVEVTDMAGPGASLPVSSVWVNGADGERTVLSTNRPSSTAVAAHPVELDGAVVLVDGHHATIGTAYAAEAHARGVPVVLDGGSWKAGLADVLPHTAVAILSSAFRLPQQECADPFWIARSVQQRWGTACVTVTRGAEDVAWRDGEREGATRVPSVEAVDTLGAGDVLHGAYCFFRYVAEYDHPSALSAACAVASSSCAFRGPREGVRRFNQATG